MIHVKYWRGGMFHPKSSKLKEPIKTAVPLPNKDGMRIQRIGLGYFYLRVPQVLVRKGKSESQPFTTTSACSPGMHPAHVIALDPGVRCFATGSDPRSRRIEIGGRDVSRLYRLCHIADQMPFRWVKAVNHRHRHSMMRAQLRILLKYPEPDVRPASAVGEVAVQGV